MHTITIARRDADDNVVDIITGTFSVDDVALLKRFVTAMTRVRATTLLQREIPAITNIRWTPTGIEIPCEPYTDTELFELLHVLRHVILSKEPTSFERIAALLGRRFGSRALGDELKALRNLFENGELSSFLQISVGDQPLFDKSVLHMWLNGAQYHTDQEKAAAWAELESSLPSESVRALVMNQLHDRVKALFQLEHVVSLVLDASNPSSQPV